MNELWCRLTSNCEWSEVDVLKLAAGVESNTIHPIGKAIVEAARAVNCPTVKVFLVARFCRLLCKVFFYLNCFHGGNTDY